jgi:hypothetical protein
MVAEWGTMVTIEPFPYETLSERITNACTTIIKIPPKILPI